MSGVLQVFLRKHSSTILTCLGAAGVVATSVLVAKETPKAEMAVVKATYEKGEELTKFEKFKTVAPIYIPSFIVGASTLGCMFGANILNKRQQAVLASAYALLDSSYKEYVGKVKELYGTEGDIKVRTEIAKDHYEEEDMSVAREKLLFFDSHTLQFFESTIEDVLSAEHRLNEMFTNAGYASLNDFYELLGLPPVEGGNAIGWSVSSSDEFVNPARIEFQHEKIKLDDNMEGYLIVMQDEPVTDYLYL
jgi:hypothetical protein